MTNKEKDKSIYIDLRTDYGFKHIFGDAELLIFFLNSLFKKEGKVVKSVTYIDKEMTPEQQDEKLVIYDVYCEVNGEEDFILEMQHLPQKWFADRALYYMCRSVSSQGYKGGDWDYSLRPVVGIFITDFHISENMKPATVQDFKLLNTQTHEVFNNNFRLINIDLATFAKQTSQECKNDLDYWIYNIKNMGTLTKEPALTKRNKRFSRLFSLAERAAMTTTQAAEYEHSLKVMRDRAMDASTRKYERAEALAEGRAEGEVLTQSKTMEIISLLKQGETPANIAERLNVDKNYVENLAMAIL